MLKKLKLPWTGASLTAKIYQSLSRREIENVTKSHFATNKLKKNSERNNGDGSLRY